jgi:hypothetical protein
MHVDGQCFCGAIRFEADADPESCILCHCTDCQALTGSAFRAIVRAPAESFRVLAGAPRTYLKVADSGTRRLHAFCGDCGSPVWAAAPVDPPNYSLRLGTLRQRTAFAPKRQQWTSSALAWATCIDDLPAFPRNAS